jgi:molybdopterin-synthase adenylyltransferase
MKATQVFSYNEAFSRSLGWISEVEQAALKNFRVAIAGVGGVGGHYAETLARLGITKFNLADPDQFEIANFNRQNGSGISTIGKNKLEVIRARILDINPKAEITIFDRGLTSENLSHFVQGVDIYLDGLDFFVLDERIWLFAELRRLKIPAIISAPLGMGTSLLVFDHDSMSFEKYFGLRSDQPATEKALRFLIGLSPSLIQRRYQVDMSRVNFEDRKVPSTPMGCNLCSGFAVTTALKILLNRRGILKAPWCIHFDAYTMQLKKSYVFAGHKNPLQTIKRFFASYLINRGKRRSSKEETYELKEVA